MYIQIRCGLPYDALFEGGVGGKGHRGFVWTNSCGGCHHGGYFQDNRYWGGTPDAAVIDGSKADISKDNGYRDVNRDKHRHMDSTPVGKIVVTVDVNTPSATVARPLLLDIHPY